jgi:cytochrome c peroxidase
MNSSWQKAGGRFALCPKALGILLVLATSTPVLTQTPLPPPLPTGIAEGAGIIRPGGTKWAIALGKALFWDQQAGSDGNACASCHFHAGADTRLRNQLNPGFNDLTVGVTPGGEISVGGDSDFGSLFSDLGILPGFMPSGHPTGPNYELQPGDFPMHLLSDETVRDSPIVSTTNDRVSSQGAVNTVFQFVYDMGKKDACNNPDTSIFHVGNFASRQVEPRNTPTVINAGLFNRNFWDGRANNTFNGVGVFGMRDISGDPNKRLVVADGHGKGSLTYLTLEDGSLASQALGPPTNAVEMSCNGRTFADVGRKLLSTPPLSLQKVALGDSVLGPLANPAGTGLRQQYSYLALIKKAFDPKWWSLPGTYKIVNSTLMNSATGYSQMESNFSMFWGISIMLYEASLVSNQSEYDGLLASGHITVTGGGGCAADSTVDPLLARGCRLFSAPPTGVGCLRCHQAPTFAEGANIAGAAVVPLLTVADVNNVIDLRDRGFANIGIRPTFTDLQSGRVDAYGNPLSYGRQYKHYLDHGKDPSFLLDPFLQQAVASGALCKGPCVPFSKLETDGSSKIPSLRNVALTPPYFSWGGYASLRQVLVVYNRGLSRRNVTDHGTGGFDAHGTSCLTGDDSGSGPDGDTPYADLVAGLQTDCNTNVSGTIKPLGMSDCEAPIGSEPFQACVNQGVTEQNDDLAALVRFLQSLSDSRVQCDAAPFDHPSLTVVNGSLSTAVGKYGVADDITFNFPAVGKQGFAKSSGFCIPNAGDLFAPGMQARSGGQKVTVH